MNTDERLKHHDKQSAAGDATLQIVLMGVSGSGKTAVGLELAEMTGWDFHDADDFHSPENKEKMRNGIPLTDADREPWLKSLHELLARYAREGKPMILACSALKRRYREILAEGFPQIRFVYLKGSFETFKRRMERRENHYMKPGMLESQFETLEEPHPDEEDAITVDAALGTPGELAGEVYRRISICF